MPDRSHVKQSLPCGNHGCDGYMKCRGGSLMVAYQGGDARRRYRKCERCGCVIETVEIQTRVLKVGDRSKVDDQVLPVMKQRTLF